MRVATLCLSAVVALGLPQAAGASDAGVGRLPTVVSADQEAEAVNPGRAAHRTPAEIKADEDFRSTMDKVFGPGRWRQTSGYRTRAQEDALRRAGAGTVAAGHVSRHSLGDPVKPGAYDAVVDGVALSAAAARLRKVGGPFARVVAEGPHGGQGPHLHVELISAQIGERGR
jgi:hypothetical protein